MKYTQPTARAMAEWIADLATNDRSALIQRVQEAIIEDRNAVRTKRDARIAGLEAENERLLGGLQHMIVEFEKMTRYGSPLAKAANENLNCARALLGGSDARAEH